LSDNKNHSQYIARDSSVINLFISDIIAKSAYLITWK
jgi:hypothetical protein